MPGGALIIVVVGSVAPGTATNEAEPISDDTPLEEMASGGATATIVDLLHLFFCWFGVTFIWTSRMII